MKRGGAAAAGQGRLRGCLGRLSPAVTSAGARWLLSSVGVSVGEAGRDRLQKAVTLVGVAFSRVAQVVREFRIGATRAGVANSP